jgi:hypothetical protein
VGESDIELRLLIAGSAGQYVGHSFKWIKQHLRIKKFYGTSDNAVKTQIWIAVAVYVLIAIVRKRLALEASLYTLLQVISVTVFEKVGMKSALSPIADRSEADMRDWCKTGGQAAIAAGGHESLAGWNFCPNSEPNVPL